MTFTIQLEFIFTFPIIQTDALYFIIEINICILETYIFRLGMIYELVLGFKSYSQDMVKWTKFEPLKE